MLDDIKYLQTIASLAESQRGSTGSNPTVAALIANAQGLISYGVHPGAGHPHAEIIAIERAHHKALTHATLYITLEPCAHTGRTPPCTERIIRSGIKRVIFGCIDPNPLVNQQGQIALKAAGIACFFSPLPSIHRLYEPYTQYHLGRSWVSLKIAHTQNRIVASSQGRPLKITGTVAHHWTQTQRAKHDACLTSAATIRSDNPRFNARYCCQTFQKPLFVISRNAHIPKNSICLKTPEKLTVFYAQSAPKTNLSILLNLGIKCIEVTAPFDSSYWKKVFEYIHAAGHQSVWCELGPTATVSCLKSNQVNRFYQLISPDQSASGLTFNCDAKDQLDCSNISSKMLHLDQLIIYHRPQFNNAPI